MEILKYFTGGLPKHSVIFLFVVCVAILITSLVKKMFKLAIIISVFTLLSGAAINSINVYESNFGVGLRGKTVTVSNKYSSDIEFDIEDVKMVSVKGDGKSSNRIKITVELKDGSLRAFYVDSQYEKMVMEILGK